MNFSLITCCDFLRDKMSIVNVEHKDVLYFTSNYLENFLIKIKADQTDQTLQCLEFFG